MTAHPKHLSRRGAVRGLAAATAAALLSACQITRTVPVPKKQSFANPAVLPASDGASYAARDPGAASGIASIRGKYRAL